MRKKGKQWMDELCSGQYYFIGILGMVSGSSSTYDLMVTNSFKSITYGFVVNLSGLSTDSKISYRMDSNLCQQWLHGQPHLPRHQLRLHGQHQIQLRLCLY